MKETELMIGDWVEFDGGPAKVINVLDKGQALIEYREQGSPFRDWVEIKCLNGIQITWDLLRGQNFVFCGNDMHAWDLDRYEVSLIQKDVIWWAATIRNLENDHFYMADVMYLHQLQHLLNLSGLQDDVLIDLTNE